MSENLIILYEVAWMHILNVCAESEMIWWEIDWGLGEFCVYMWTKFGYNLKTAKFWYKLVNQFPNL